MPEKLAELQELWLTEARKYNVLPLDDRRIERFNPDLAGRPVLVTGNTQTLYGGMGRLTEASILNIKNKSHAVTAEVEVPDVRRRGRDHRPGRRLRRLEPLRQGRQAPVLLQPARPAALHHRGRHADPGRHPPGADGVRLRRRRARQGRHRGALRRRDQGRRGPRRRDGPHGLLGRRDRRHRPRHRLPGQHRLRTARPASSPDGSTGCRSTSARTPRTPTTSSPPRSGSASPWRASRRARRRGSGPSALGQPSAALGYLRGGPRTPGLPNTEHERSHA